MYKLDANEAKEIPILEVAKLVIPDLTRKGNKITALCRHHNDKNLGNFSIRPKENYAHCFACGAHLSTIDLVMTYNGLDFYDALEFLYSHFTNYFTVNEDYKENDTIQNEWKGLSLNDYNFLGIKTNMYLNGKLMSIKQFAKLFPKEHDRILAFKLNKKMIQFYDLQKYIDKSSKDIQNDYRNMENYFKKIIHKGFMLEKSKKNLKRRRCVNF
ncbi:MAG: CHC2 zinc finger domain-containing protein [Candidatus Woesearchaeota archaeon]